MTRMKNPGLAVLNEQELLQLSAGNENFCAAMAGAAIATGLMGAYPAAITFGAIFMAACWDGH